MCLEACVLRCAGEAAAERKGESKVVASVTFLHQLNEVQDGLLLAGTADGALRVWRNYAHKAEQRLATAWQVGTFLPLLFTSALVITGFYQTALMPDCSLEVTGQERGHLKLSGTRQGCFLEDGLLNGRASGL